MVAHDENPPAEAPPRDTFPSDDVVSSAPTAGMVPGRRLGMLARPSASRATGESDLNSRDIREEVESGRADKHDTRPSAGEARLSNASRSHRDGECEPGPAVHDNTGQDNNLDVSEADGKLRIG
jgi:hypothetical protein